VRYWLINIDISNNKCVKHKLRDGVQIDKITYLTKNNIDKTPEGIVLDDLGLNNPCCRRHMLTHVDIE